MLDIDQWQAALRADRRLTQTARIRVAQVLADRFRAGDGSCQLSAEAICRAAGLVSLLSVRDALSSLRLSGYLTSERAPDTVKHGMRHRPTLPAVPANSN
jgi:hypothetical protein